jgi:hypothetical protein
MSDAEEGKIARAAYADSDQIVKLLHDPSPEVLKALLGNSNLREDDVLVIANRKNIPGAVLDMIARDKRWTESYPVRLALAKNPKTPLSVSLSIVRYLHLFDIAEMTRSHLLSPAFRHKVESIVRERVPAMPLGEKKSLAKMAVGNVLFRLLQDADADVVGLCLANPRMQESHLFKIISRKDTRAETVRMIAGHQNWSGRPLVRYALVRNEHTPLAISERFLQTMKVLELRELHADPTLPLGVKPLVYRELLSRGQDPGKRIEEPVFEIDENDDAVLDTFEDIEEPAGPETTKEEKAE